MSKAQEGCYNMDLERQGYNLKPALTDSKLHALHPLPTSPSPYVAGRSSFLPQTFFQDSLFQWLWPMPCRGKLAPLEQWEHELKEAKAVMAYRTDRHFTSSSWIAQTLYLDPWMGKVYSSWSCDSIQGRNWNLGFTLVEKNRTLPVSIA